MTGPAPAPPAPDRRGAALSAAILALPIALLAGVGAFALLGGFSPHRSAPRTAATGPVTAEAPPPSPGLDKPCATLLNRLPRVLAGNAARPVTAAPDRVVAWGDPPVVLRCGVARPAAAGAAAQEFVVDGVPWVYADEHGTGVWTTTKRTAYVEVRMPPKYHGTGSQLILTELAAPIAESLPRTG